LGITETERPSPSGILSQVASQESAAQAWKLILPLLFLLCALIFFLYRNTFAVLVHTWDSGFYSHGYLIPFISAYLIWERREVLVSINPHPSYWLLSLYVPLGVLWLSGFWGDINIVQQFAAVSMLLLTVVALLGVESFRVLRFPLLFLLLAVPFGEGLIPPLQDVTAQVAVLLLRFTHIPVLLEGRTITVPGAVWEVAEACAGVRYLVSSIVLSILFAEITYRSTKRRLLFVVVAIIVPVIANCVRAYGIILLGYLSNNKLAHGVDHIIYGWIFFLAVMVPLFVIGSHWSEPKPHLGRKISFNGHATAASFALQACLCGVLIAMPAFAARNWNTVTVPVNERMLAPAVSDPWTTNPYVFVNWITDSDLNATNREFLAYSDGIRRANMFIAYYASPEQGPAILISGDRLVNKQLSLIREQMRSIIVDGKTLQVRETMVRNGSSQMLVWYWYWVGDEYTSSPYQVKLHRAWINLTRQRKPSAVLAVSASYALDPQEARSTLESFLQHASILKSLEAASQ
jgi:exosortase A